MGARPLLPSCSVFNTTRRLATQLPPCFPSSHSFSLPARLLPSQPTHSPSTSTSTPSPPSQATPTPPAKTYPSQSPSPTPSQPSTLASSSPTNSMGVSPTRKAEHPNSTRSARAARQAGHLSTSRTIHSGFGIVRRSRLFRLGSRI